MKSPPQQFPDHVARELTLEFMRLSPLRNDPTQEEPRASRGTHRSVKDDHALHARAPRHVRAD
jgi:hypothetical protein